VINGDKLLTPFSSPLSRGFAAICHNYYDISMTDLSLIASEPVAHFPSEPLDSLNSPDSDRMFLAQPAALCGLIGKPPNRGKM
jgi:hypothetical protein